MNKAARVGEFLKRLNAASPASSAGEAYAMLVAIFEEVEKQHRDADDPMFPPSGDYAYDVAGRPDLIEFYMVVHGTIIADNGAILIRNRKTKMTIFEKAGADGRGVNL